MADLYCWRCQPARFPMAPAPREYVGIRNTGCRPVPAWALYYDGRPACLARPFLNGVDMGSRNIVEACAGPDGWLVAVVYDEDGHHIACPCGSQMYCQEVHSGHVELVWATPPKEAGC